MAKKPHTDRLKHQRPIEDELAALQNAHRLAIHIWEGNEPFKPHPSYVFPRFSFDSLTSKSPDAIATSIGDQTMPMMSMSLLPSQSSGLGLRPFCCHWNHSFLHCGYLVDVSEKHPHPARIARAALHGLGSGPNPLDKAMRLGRKGTEEVPELEALYDAYIPPRKRGKARQTAEGERAFQQAIAGDDGIRLSATQLDLLGNHYHTPMKPEDAVDEDHPHLVDFNEILVAASRCHLKAIVVPCMENTEQRADWFMPLTQLSGALAGLQHLKQGVDLPVVTYHVTPPQLGACHYLAQGEAECIKMALTACKELETLGVFGTTRASANMAPIRGEILFPKLQEAVAEALNGLDISTPLAKQKTNLAELDARARAATKQSRA